MCGKQDDLHSALRESRRRVRQLEAAQLLFSLPEVLRAVELSDLSHFVWGRALAKPRVQSFRGGSTACSTESALMASCKVIRRIAGKNPKV
eukprot:s288_g27.t1